MQIRNQISYGNEKSNTLILKKPKMVSFGQGPSSALLNENNDEKKKGIPWKKITNVMGVAAFIGALTASLAYSMTRPTAEKASKSLSKSSKAFKAIAEDTELHNELKNVKTNLRFKSGLLFKKWQGTGEELLNNLVYGFGTVIVMPLVILFSPIGKKKASKEDKMFTVLRQPLSFAMLFPMQVTVDKFFKDLVPKLVSKNALEEKDKDGNVIPDKIKFNDDKIKSNFKDEVGSILKNQHSLDGEELKIVDSLLSASAKTAEETTTAVGKVFTNSEHTNVKALAGKSELITDISNKLFKCMEASNAAAKKTKLLGLVLTIAGNVLISAPVGCTALNVAYGGMMKNIGSKIPKDSPDASKPAKGGN